MKSSFILLGLSFVHFYLASAKALLAVFESSVVEGETYPVEWLSDSEDYLELLLVRQNDHGWSSIQTLFQNRTSTVPGGTYQWKVATNLTAGSGYGLWLSSTPTDPNDITGYADLTEWFDIEFANGSMPTSSASSLAATTSATGSTFSLNRSASATATTTTGTAQPANTSDTVTVSQHEDNLSKSAIIGMSVGISVGVTLVLIVIAVVVLHRRRKAQAAMLASSKDLAPDSDCSKTTRPSFMTTATLVELPEDPRVGRAEIPGQSTQPQEKDAGDVVQEKKTIPPEKPVELE